MQLQRLRLDVLCTRRLYLMCFALVSCIECALHSSHVFVCFALFARGAFKTQTTNQKDEIGLPIDNIANGELPSRLTVDENNGFGATAKAPKT